MDFTRKIKKLENKTRTWRTNFYTRKSLALAASIVFLAVALISFLALIHDKATPWAWYLCPSGVCILWATWIGYSTSQTPTFVENSWSPPKYPNLFMLKKGLGQVVALTFFTFLEEKMKGKNEVLALTLSFGVFLHLLFVMVLFDIREDFDVSTGFLAASFELSFQSSKGWGTVALIGVTSILCALKNFFIGGRSSKRKKQRKKQRWGSDMRVVIDMETMVVPSANLYERNLANFRTRLYGCGAVLLASAEMTYAISFGFLLHIVGEDKVREYANILMITFLGWMFYIAYDSSKRPEYVDEEVDEDILHNLHSLVKSVGQVLCLTLFTFVDGNLERQPIGLVMGLCISAYLHLLSVMVFLRVKEDLDLVGGFVSAAFGLFYKISIGWDKKVLLVLLTATFVVLKNYVIGGKVAPVVDWLLLPETDLYG